MHETFYATFSYKIFSLFRSEYVLTVNLRVPFLLPAATGGVNGVDMVQQDEQAGHVIAPDAGGGLGVIGETALADLSNNLRRLHACIQPLAHKVDLHIVKERNWNDSKNISRSGFLTACWLLRQSHTPSQASRKKRSPA